MAELWKAFWHEEEGLGTVEVVILIAVLVAVALIFGKQIKVFVQEKMTKDIYQQGTGALQELHYN